MSKKMPKNTLSKLIYIIILLLLASSIISYFKSYHFVLGLFFIAIIIFYLVRNYNKKKEEKSAFWLSLFGIFFTSISGLIVEIWGTCNEYWVYLDIPKNISVPFWVPFAWGLAYVAIYKVELTLLQHFSSPFNKWLFCIILPATILPVIGEVIVIYFGTWNYYWKPQFFGMPPLAVLLLCIFHVSIFLTMCKICKIFSINDPVYSSFISK